MNAVSSTQTNLRIVPSALPAFVPGDVSHVSVEQIVGGQTADDLYEMYRAAFIPLHSRAAFGHLLPRAEFNASLQAPTVNKLIAWDHKGRPVGMTTLTTDLSTEPVSEWFYAERYPTEYARGDLFYLGFLLVRPDAQRGGVLVELLKTVATHVSAAGGVVAFDVCGFNDETFKFAQVCAMIAGRIRPSSIEKIDVQSFYAVSFPAAL